jgi:predicted acetyltransferase
VSDFTTAPLHEPSIDALGRAGLRLELVDTSDLERFGPWYEGMTRGFHGRRLDADLRDGLRSALAFRRTTGVYDGASHEPRIPVGTVNSWPDPLTLPGERTVDGWAISCLTVAATHRRRGVARAMVEAELGTAASLGVPLAMLTVSESPIYGRFGFAPAAMAADWTIDTHRARWTGPVPEGRVDFIPIEEWRSLVTPLHERARLLSPGEVGVPAGRWDQIAGILADDEGYAARLRAIQYTDAEGEVRGIAIFQVRGGDEDFGAHRASIEALVTETDDAYAALWRFVLELDLVRFVEAPLRSVDEPVRWMISDWRAAKVSTWEHQYLRLLDVPASFQARSYASAGSVAFEVSDPLGYAEGTWLLTVTGADAVVERVGSVPSGVPALSLSVNELSALYLGGVAVPTLVAAGRVRELTPGAAIEADVLLHSPVVPWLSRWY